MNRRILDVCGSILAGRRAAIYYFMNRISRLYLTIPLGLFLLVVAATAQNPFKFAVVDTQMVIESYKKAQDANEVLITAEKNLRSDLEKRREEITNLHDKLTKQKLFLEETEVTALEQDILQRQQDYQRELQEGSKAITDKRQELLEPIIIEMEELIKEIGKSEKYSLIFEKRLSVLYVDEKYDLTQRIIDILNARVEQSESKPDEAKEKPAAPKSTETPK